MADIGLGKWQAEIDCPVVQIAFDALSDFKRGPVWGWPQWLAGSLWSQKPYFWILVKTKHLNMDYSRNNHNQINKKSFSPLRFATGLSLSCSLLIRTASSSTASSSGSSSSSSSSDSRSISASVYLGHPLNRWKNKGKITSKKPGV